MKSNHYRVTFGFTIVELLVVIVVIAILAVITIVSYTGITNQAVVASLTSNLDQASRILKMDQVTNGNYPTSLAEANEGKGIPSSSGVTYSYGVNNDAIPATFCVSAVKGDMSYEITNNIAPISGDCLDYGLMFYVYAGNASSYPGSGTTWIDISGNGRNGTLYNGVGYTSSDGGALMFDGVTQFVTYPVGTMPVLISFSCSIWVYITGDGSLGANGFMNGKSFRLFAYNSNNTIGIQIGGADPYSDNSLIVLNRNQWVNIGLSYDGKNRNYYINGVLTKQNPTTGIPTSTHDGELGSIQGVSYAYSGRISSARLYNRVLSNMEFQQIFDSIKGRYGL